MGGDMTDKVQVLAVCAVVVYRADRLRAYTCAFQSRVSALLGVYRVCRAFDRSYAATAADSCQREVEVLQGVSVFGPGELAGW